MFQIVFIISCHRILFSDFANDDDQKIHKYMVFFYCSLLDQKLGYRTCAENM